MLFGLSAQATGRQDGSTHRNELGQQERARWAGGPAGKLTVPQLRFLQTFWGPLFSRSVLMDVRRLTEWEE